MLPKAQLHYRTADNPVEEARRAMVSAGYVLPPECQPMAVDTQRQQHSPVLSRETVPMPVAARRRHSISCSPVGNWRTDAGLPTLNPDQPRLHQVDPATSANGNVASVGRLAGQKRRFSFPDGGLGNGVPLTAFLPDEFKRRRISPVDLTGESPKLPSIAQAVSEQVSEPPAVVVPPPSACLPPHKAATLDRPHFGAPLAAVPTSLTQQPQLGTSAVWPVASTYPIRMSPSPISPVRSPIPALVSPGDSSTAPSSPTTPPSVTDQLGKESETKELDEAERQRKVKLVDDILDEMDRRNAEAAAAESGGLAAGDSSIWPAGAIRPPQRRRVGKDQTGVLDKVFRVEQMPNQAVKKRLADGLGMSYKQIQIWFQNKRARSKRATETPQRTSHTFHTMLVSSDGRFMKKQLAKGLSPPDHPTFASSHAMPALSPLAMRSAIRSQ